MAYNLDIKNISVPNFSSSVSALKGASNTLNTGITSGIKALEDFRKNTQAQNDQKVLSTLANIQNENQLNELLGSGVLDNANISPEMQKQVFALRSNVLSAQKDRANINRLNADTGRINALTNSVNTSSLLNQKKYEDTQRSNQIKNQGIQINNELASLRLNSARTNLAKKNQAELDNQAGNNLLNQVLSNPDVVDPETAKSVIYNTDVPLAQKQAAYKALGTRLKNVPNNTLFGTVGSEAQGINDRINLQLNRVSKDGTDSITSFISNESKRLASKKNKQGIADIAFNVANEVFDKPTKSNIRTIRNNMLTLQRAAGDRLSDSQLGALLLHTGSGESINLSKAKALVKQVTPFLSNIKERQIAINSRTRDLKRLQNEVTRLSKQRSKLSRSRNPNKTEINKISKRIAQISNSIGSFKSVPSYGKQLQTQEELQRLRARIAELTKRSKYQKNKVKPSSKYKVRGIQTF